GVCHGLCTYYSTSDVIRHGVIINSPGYPQAHYNNDEWICWQFESIFTSLSIRIKSIDLERDHDWLQIYDGSSYQSVTKLTGHHREVNRVINVKSNTMRVIFTSDNTTTDWGFQACVCLASSKCDCHWLSESGSKDWSSREDEDNTNGLLLSTNGIIGICLCIGIPLLMIAIFCIYSKCSKSGQVAPEQRTGASPIESPKPAFVLYTSPPPYSEPVPPPSYEEAVDDERGHFQTGYPMMATQHRTQPSGNGGNVNRDEGCNPSSDSGIVFMSPPDLPTSPCPGYDLPHNHTWLVTAYQSTCQESNVGHSTRTCNDSNVTMVQS
ncbi:hypothetical protein LSH36_407g02022, partial [Paralvinella palmiformis]